METPNQQFVLDCLQERRHSSAAENLDVTASTTSNDHKVSSQCGAAARSRGWVPLSFPRSALLKHPAGFHHNSNSATSTTSSTSNRYFPLHEDVLLATVRELLLLDGTLDPTNLNVRNNPSKFLRAQENGSEPPRSESCDCVVVVAPRFWCHMNPSQWLLAPDVVSPSHRKGTKKPKNAQGAMLRKRKHSQLKSLSPAKKQMTECTLKSTVREHVAKIMESKLPLVISSLDEQQQQPDLVDEDVHHRDDTVPVAEYVACTIARRSYAVDNRVSHDVMQGNRLLNCDDSKLQLDEDERRPRKVSDVDQESMLSTLKESIKTAFRVTDEVVGDLDMARFVNLSERAADGTFALKRTDLPTLLDASIATESSLRDEAIRMTSSMTRSFTDAAIRLFLGYKAPTLKRDRLIQVLADFLFDASHAMFAWDQTMQELLANKKLMEPLSSKQWNELDDTVKNSLFDERALRKIGGFEPSSVLPHAISISRLRKRGISWEAFAKTVDGKRLLAHHRSGADNLLVGQKRRGHRQRHRVMIPSEPSSDKVQRSRCSSVGSADMDGLVSDDSVPESPFFADVPSTAQVHLAREEGSSWGILLAKEGDMCVVARAGGSTTDTTKRRGEIRCGDMILRCTNERGETACTPCSSGRQPQEIGWFRTMVDIFKSSKELHLAIQRVGV